MSREPDMDWRLFARSLHHTVAENMRKAALSPLPSSLVLASMLTVNDVLTAIAVAVETAMEHADVPRA